MDGKHKWSRFLCSVELRHSIAYTQPHGRAFKVLVPKTFEREICPVYFGHSRYSTFLRDLNRYSFKHLTKGDDRNSKCFCGVHHVYNKCRVSDDACSDIKAYYHEFMLRGRFHLCDFMPRSKDARRLDADPDNEPNFYNVSEIFPLDDPAIVSASPAIPPPFSSTKKDKKDPPRTLPGRRSRNEGSFETSTLRPKHDSKPSSNDGNFASNDSHGRSTSGSSQNTITARPPYDNLGAASNPYFTQPYQISSQNSFSQGVPAPQHSNAQFIHSTSQSYYNAPQVVQQSGAALAPDMAAANLPETPATNQASVNNSASSSPTPPDNAMLQALLVVLLTLPQYQANQQNQTNIPNTTQPSALQNTLVSDHPGLQLALPSPTSITRPQQPAPTDWFRVIPALANANLLENENIVLFLTALLQSQSQGQDASSLAVLLALVLIQFGGGSSNNNSSSPAPGG